MYVDIVISNVFNFNIFFLLFLSFSFHLPSVGSSWTVREIPVSVSLVEAVSVRNGVGSSWTIYGRQFLYQKGLGTWDALLLVSHILQSTLVPEWAGG